MIGLLLVCIGLYMVFYFRISIRYLMRIDLINEKLFD